MPTPAPVSAAVLDLAQQTAALSAEKARVEQMQKDLETARSKELNGLHTKLGYKTPADFLTAYRGVVNVTVGTKSTRRPASRKARTEISDEVREAIKSDLREGKLTGLEIAAKYKISTGTVQNIKKEAGLVEARS